MLSIFTTVIVVGAIYHLLVSTQRLSRLQGERARLQFSIRAGAFVFTEELGELSTVEGGAAHQNDILAFGPSGLTYRAMRGMGFICKTLDPTTIRLARGSFSGHRDPQAGRDEVYVFAPEGETKDSWRPANIVGVATAAPCPGGQGPAITLSLSSGGWLGPLEPGTPVRIAELMELRLYQSDMKSWLGARSVSAGEAIQPLVGPLTNADGFQLEYLDGAGAPTTDAARIRTIRARLRGITEGDTLVEELTGQITLRNSWRP